MDLLGDTRKLLARRSCSQMDVARGARVSQKLVSNIERGEVNNVSYQRLMRIREYLLSAKRRRA